VIDSSADGGISPVGKIIAEIAQVRKNSGFQWPAKKQEDGE